MNQTTALEEILEYYGMDKQVKKYFEEAGELSIELSKFLLGNGDKNKLAEKIADAQIILRQIILGLDIGIEIAEWTELKIERQLGRIEALNE